MRSPFSTTPPGARSIPRGASRLPESPNWLMGLLPPTLEQELQREIEEQRAMDRYLSDYRVRHAVKPEPTEEGLSSRGGGRGGGSQYAVDAPPYVQNLNSMTASPQDMFLMMLWLLQMQEGQDQEADRQGAGGLMRNSYTG